MRSASLLLGALVVTSCERLPTDLNPPAPVAPSFAISHSGHLGGNPYFSFLPPLAPRREFTGAFDGSLNPEVVITRAGGGEVTVVRVLEAAVRADDDIEHYHVNWHTKADNLDPDLMYRITVRVGLLVFGFADVDVVSSGRELRNVNTGEFVALLANARTLPIKFRIEEGATTIVGPAGGILTAADGNVALLFPIGGVAEPTAIAVQPASAFPANAGVVPGTVFDFTPDGLLFEQPVGLTIRYDPSLLPPNVMESSLRLVWAHGDSWQEVPASSVNLADKTVSGFIEHFSTYGILGGTDSAVPSRCARAMIDGQLTAGEWDEASQTPLTVNVPGGGTTPGTLYIMNDAAHLCLAVKFARNVVDAGGNSLVFQFDNDNDGIAENGDDVIDMNPALGFRDFFRNNTLPPCDGTQPAAHCVNLDTDNGGTIDGAGAFGNDGTFSVYELSHPLNSGDPHDFALSVGSKVGYWLHLRMIGPDGLADTFYPGVRNFAQIEIRPPRPQMRIRTDLPSEVGFYLDHTEVNVYLDLVAADGGTVQWLVSGPGLSHVRSEIVPNLPAVTLTLPVSIAGPGNYRVTALWTSPNGELRGQADAVLPMQPPTGLAIVVTGIEPLDPIFPVAEYLTDLVVKTFRRRGLPDNPADRLKNRIIYLHPNPGHDFGDGSSDVDGPPSLASLERAINNIRRLLQWSPDRLAQDILRQPLTVYLVGNIDAGNLQLPNGERLSPTQLDAWLDRLSEAVVTATGGAVSQYPINVVIDAHGSGNFIQPLAGPQRFIATSTDIDGLSYWASGGSVSFSSYFLSRIAAGHYIYPSWAYAQLNLLSSSQTVGQRPQIEASGNGQPNEIADELILASVPLEYRNTTVAPPRLLNALGQIDLRGGVSAAMLWVYVDNPEGRRLSIQAWVVPPEGVFLPARLLDLTASTSTSDRFEGVYTEFLAPGTWSVVYVAEDEAGNMATPLVKTLIVRN